MAPEPASLSVSVGLQFGSSDRPYDVTGGATAGVNHVGLEGSSTINLSQLNVGLVISTSIAWASGSVGASTPITKNKK